MAAEDKTAARDHWERGTKFYDLGKYDDAIREFEAAYEAKGDPAFLYNLAQSHRLAGHSAEALRFYRTYLRYVPKPANRADIEDHIRELEKTIADHPGSEGAATSPAPIAAGPSTGDTAPQGGATAAPPPSSSPSTNAAAGGSQTGAPGATGTASSGGGTPAAPPPFAPGGPGANGPSELSGGAPAAKHMSGRRIAGIAIAAGGGGVMVVGGIFGLVARNQSKKVEDAAANLQRFDPSVESLGKTAQTIQWVCYGIGAAAVVTGLVLYATAPARVEAPRVAIAPSPVPGSGGALSLRVTF